MLDHVKSSSSIDTVSSYLPALVLRRFAIEPNLPTEPTREHFSAAVLFADISGFTALTEKLAKQGAVGAEQLTQIINGYFSQLISVIHAHGGDVVKFAGDALVALWLTSEEAKFLNPDSQEDKATYDYKLLVTVTHRAAQCGLSIQETLKNYTVSEDITLSLHVSIGAGEIVALHLGGVFGRWELLISGSPVVQVGLADKQAKPTEVLLSPQAWQLLKDKGSGEQRLQAHIHLTQIEPLSLRPLIIPMTSPAAESVMWSCIPRAVLNRLRKGQSQWLAELRCLTVLFINLPDLNEQSSSQLAQKGMQILQKSLYHYEGSINKLNVDDKGTTLIAALGLPPLSHEDDALRGVQAALTIKKRLDELGWSCAIGVATGRVFCGAVGSLTRREYTMLGDTVNLAARLMQAAPKNILCDVMTYRATLNELRYERLPNVTVKGKLEAVPVYRPYGLKAVSAPRRQTTFVGREHENACLIDQLQQLQRSHSSIVIIEGEAGIGKSRLVQELISQIKKIELEYLIAEGNSIEKSTPYYAWRPVFSQLLGISRWTDETLKQQQPQILEYLRELDESLFIRAPLLNGLLPLDLVDNEFTLNFSGQKRQEKTFEFLADLLQTIIHRKGRHILILEDAHWLDSASWKLLEILQQEVQPLLLVLATRPFGDSPPESYQSLYYSTETHILNLERLSDEDTITLVCQRLGVSNLPEPLIHLIKKKTQGHPFFSEQLASALRDSGLLQIREGQCYLSSDKELQTFRFPDTIQGMVASRIDRLAPELQLTLKIASVIGPEFSFTLLQTIYPIEADKPLLLQYLETLNKLDITPLKSRPPELTYQFKHILIQEVTYDLMLFSQRRGLHRQIAEWYENTYQEDLSLYYPLLVHHWNKAEVPSKAVEYAEKAGQQASYRHANRDAVLFFNQAITLSQSSATLSQTQYILSQNDEAFRIDEQRQALWERQLGEAYAELGQLAKGQQHLDRALALWGRPRPKKQTQLLINITRQSLCLGLSQFCGFQRPRRRSNHFLLKNYKEELRQIAATYERIAYIAYYDQNIWVFFHACLNSLNLAQAVGSTTALARAYANMCFATELVRLPRLAALFSQRAQSLIREVEQFSSHSPEMHPPENMSLQKKGDLAWVYQLVGIYSFTVGKLKTGQYAFQRAIAAAQQVQDKRRCEESLSHLSMLAYHQGRFQQSIDYCEELYVIAKQRGDLQAQQWGLCGKAINYLRLGQLKQAAHYLELAGTLLTDEKIVTDRIWLHGLFSVVRWQQTHSTLARQEADKATSFIKLSKPTNPRCFEGYSGVAEVYLRLWEKSLSLEGLKITTDIKSARQACQALHRYARVFVFARPRAWLWQGLYYWLAGHSKKAYQAWQKSLMLATQLRMPYEKALIYSEMERHSASP